MTAASPLYLTTMHERRTKVVATLGPATSSRKTLTMLIAAGVDVVRINASHGTQQDHQIAMTQVREVSAQLNRPVGILYDLQGPKIRMGTWDGPEVVVQAGDTFTLAVARAARAHELPCDYPHLDGDVKAGDPLLIDDGQLMGTVVSVAPGTVVVRAQNNGKIAPRKGINLPASVVSADAISHKDRGDALFAVACEVDFIAMSFVRKPQDIEELQKIIGEAGGKQPVIAKIETPEGLHNLHGILSVSWGVMVARGDLGVELSASLVPMAQKRIIRAARHFGKPVITATQMLDSMTHRLGPTRAEASDVANAVLDGTDAVMLSQETAIGSYPVQTVEMMGAIIDAVEADEQAQQPSVPLTAVAPKTGQVLAHAACSIAKTLSAPIIATYTATGRVALWVSQMRPQQLILAFANTPEVHRRLTLIWGIVPMVDPHADEPVRREGLLDALLLQHKLAQKKDQVVLMVGAPNGASGTTHSIMVHRVGDPLTQQLSLHGAAAAELAGAALW